MCLLVHLNHAHHPSASLQESPGKSLYTSIRELVENRFVSHSAKRCFNVAS
jgi:hypothetical protein